LIAGSSGNDDVREPVSLEYDKWHALRRFEGDPTSPVYSWHRNVGRLLRVSPRSRILEIGCGRGDFAAALAERFSDCEIIAVDFSNEAIFNAQERYGPIFSNLRFEVADATSLSFPDHSFDVVISCECLEHVLEPASMTREMHRVLKPLGSFYLTTENYLNGMILMWAKSLLTGIPIDTGSGTQPHENFFLFWRVRRMLVKSGLSVTHMESDHFQWLMLPHVNPSKLCTPDFTSSFFKRMFRPFGRHFTFVGQREA